MGRPFTESELELIERNYEDLSHEDLAAVLGRTEASIRNACYKRGWRKRAEYWTEEETEKLIQYYHDADGGPIDLDNLEAIFGRHRSNICRKAREFGLTEQAREHSEETKESLSKIRKDWFKENDHPRGMLGGKHDKNARAKMSKAGRARSARMTKEEKSAIAMKAVQTRIERYGSGNPGIHNPSSNPYSRTKSGKREDLDGLFVRSSWEANYARYLNWLVENDNELLKWEYEPDTFVFEGITRGTRTYTPDFKLFYCDGRIEYHEVKGWMDPKSVTRLRRMKKYFPQIDLVLIDAGVYRGIENSVSKLIPNWE